MENGLKIYFLQQPSQARLDKWAEERFKIQNKTTINTNSDTAKWDDEFKIENGVLISYTGTDENLQIPDGVTEIDTNAFKYCTQFLKTVTLSKTVQSIGCTALMYCVQLKWIEVARDNPFLSSEDGILYNHDKTRLLFCPIQNEFQVYTIRDSVREIGSYAFFGCNHLTEVTFPNSVIYIGEAAFRSCSNLKNVTIPDSVKAIGNYAFLNCGCLAKVKLPDTVILQKHTFSSATKIVKVCSDFVIEDGVLKQYIGQQAVAKVPEGVIHITSESFRYSDQVEKIEIANSVESIDISSFLFCDQLREITVQKENLYFSSAEGVLYNKNQTDLLYCPRKAVSEHYVIKRGVRYIGSFAFFGCELLSSVEIPHTVTVISNAAFRDCCSLARVEIPDTVKTIGRQSFYGCTRLKKVKLFTGTEVSDNTFDKQTEIYYESARKDFVIDENGILTRYLGQDSMVIVPYGVMAIGAQAFQYNWTVNTVILPETVAAIYNDAFAYCTGLVNITVPPSVQLIGMRVFLQCTSLMNVTLSQGLKVIGWNAFQNCTALVSIKIPDTVKEIAAATFVNCPKLTNVYVSKKTKLKFGVFKKCPSKKIIPYTLT